MSSADLVTKPAAEQTIVGQRAPRVDAGERVTGRALYPADFTLPGMVHGKIARSPHAHARIVAIDTAKARALPGVLAVVTAADFPDLPMGASVPFGETGQDVWSIARTNIARGKVHWVGQPVAAVAALDVHIAEAAVALIDVTYEVLPAVLEMEAAMAADAPVLHDHVFTKGVEPAPRTPSNVGARTLVARGDAGKVLAASDVVVEMETRADTAHQGFIEPHAVVAAADPQGFLTIWASTQGAFNTELQTAAILGLPTSKLKVVALECGGGFGGKIATHVEPVAARMSQLCGRPVKIVMSRAEVLHSTGPAAGARTRVKVGATRDGKVTAIEGRYLMDAGGFPGVPTTLMMQASAALYQWDAVRLEGFDVATNKPKTEAYRGPGGIQAFFCVEQAIDRIAERLGLCPLELRRRNASVTGSTMPIGTPFPSLGLTALLDAVAAHPCWTDPLGTGRLPRGRGLALGYWRGTSMTSACHVTLAGDGRVVVTMGATDISGTRTAMAQVAAEEFELPLDDVHVVSGDTKSVGYSDAAAGSRVGRTMAAAVTEACRDAIGQLRRRAGERLQAPAEDVGYAAGVFRAERTGGEITLQQLMHATLGDGAVIGRGVSSKLPLGVEVGVHVADVEVDTATGRIGVLRYTAFQDPGRALNPVAVEGQIEGSVVQGLGWALTEGYDYDEKGRLRNASLLDYRLPTALDVPAIESVLVETPVPGVPYGVRGVGEVPIVPPAACIANAVARAVGVRMTRMPMTPERVVAAIVAQRK
jgi:xanthine dehydrogenase molybdenum-binding subunit